VFASELRAMCPIESACVHYQCKCMEISQSTGELDWEKTIRCAGEICVVYISAFLLKVNKKQKKSNWKRANEENQTDFVIGTAHGK